MVIRDTKVDSMVDIREGDIMVVVEVVIMDTLIGELREKERELLSEN